MAVESNEQYKPPSDNRTDTNDGLDVGAVRDLAEGINNYLYKVARFPLSFVGVGTAALLTDTGGTFQRVYGSFGARDFGPQFDKLAYAFGHEREAGSGEVVWTIYSGPKLYQGPEGSAADAFDTSYLGSPFDSVTFPTTSDTHAFARGDDLFIKRNGLGRTYITITAAADDDTTQALVRSFTMAPFSSVNG